MKKKILFVSSSGGHYEQLMMLKPIMDRNETLILTEKTSFNKSDDKRLLPVNRKEKLFLFKMVLNSIVSLYYLLSFKPQVIISTGTLCSIPICLLAKKRGIKVIYIESFAKVKTPTKTGEYLYGKVDLFIVQWEELLDVYPEAEFLGGIY